MNHSSFRSRAVFRKMALLFTAISAASCTPSASEEPISNQSVRRLAPSTNISLAELVACTTEKGSETDPFFRQDSISCVSNANSPLSVSNISLSIKRLRDSNFRSGEGSIVFSADWFPLEVNVTFALTRPQLEAGQPGVTADSLGVSRRFESEEDFAELGSFFVGADYDLMPIKIWPSADMIGIASLFAASSRVSLPFTRTGISPNESTADGTLSMIVRGPSFAGLAGMDPYYAPVARSNGSVPVSMQARAAASLQRKDNLLIRAGNYLVEPDGTLVYVEPSEIPAFGNETVDGGIDGAIDAADLFDGGVTDGSALDGGVLDSSTDASDAGRVDAGTCGSDGQPACREPNGVRYCNPGHVSMDVNGVTTCFACGNDQQRACREPNGVRYCNPGHVSMDVSGVTTCFACGNDQQRACREPNGVRYCNPGHVSVDVSGVTTCFVCGDEGQRACRNSSNTYFCNDALRVVTENSVRMCRP